MAILGSIIKGVIDLKEKFTPEDNHIQNQWEVFNELLDKAKDTKFGKHYGFKTMQQLNKPYQAFKDNIPYFDYNKINAEWWSKLHKGEENITWPGGTEYFALSSGTTGKSSKQIPITNDMMDSIVQAGMKQVFSLSNFNLESDFFDKEILMLGSSTNLIEENDHLLGEISGISANNMPIWFKRYYYKPGEEIAEIDNWDQRVAQIVKKAPQWDIGAISGIPSWVELMLQEVINHYQLDSIHQVWPNLQVYTSGGVAFDPYKKSFDALMGKPVTVIDTYLASEGFIAFQARPETTAMKLITDNGIFFEFIPFDADYINEDGSVKDSAPSITIGDVQLNQDYILIISTVTGAWRYTIGDTIEFTDIQRAEIRITGRTKFFLNTVGSQLSVNKLNDAVNYLEDKFALKIPEYTLCAKRFGNDFYHSWYLGTEDTHSSHELSAALDQHLAEANKNYKVARSKALKGVKVKLTHPSVFYEWSGKNKKKGGQVKMERVMGEDKFAEWEKFVEENT